MSGTYGTVEAVIVFVNRGEEIRCTDKHYPLI